MNDFYHALTRLAASGGSGVLAEILETTGSAPRHAGAQMLLAPDGAFFGTVGGGALEYRVQQEARQVLAGGTAVRKTYSLDGGPGEELDAVCGGSALVELRPLTAAEAAALLETLPAPPKAFIYGAGHVGKALADVLHLLDVPTAVWDDRAELLTPQRFPFAQRVCCPVEAAPMEPRPEDLIVIMTHGHSFDYALLRRAMATDAGYIGVMASRRKAAAFRRRLSDEDVSPDAPGGRLHCPIGLSIRAETPAEIAVSIAAELIAVMRTPPAFQ